MLLLTNKMSNAKNQRKRRPWPEKRRKKQAQNCRKTKPWKHTTGPKTAEGKEKSAQNAYKHGLRSAPSIRLRKVLTWQRAYMKALWLRYSHLKE